MIATTGSWHPTACILCSRNCGIEVQLDGPRLSRIRGDGKHPLSEGYLCQKAARLDHYQNHRDRLATPLRRRPDGAFEEISWDVAIREIATRLLAIRAARGGRAFAFYGGGGQGNHLGGVYARGLLDAMGSRYHYSALAQEKTGDFWVNGRLFGRQTCHVSEGVEEAEVVVFIGTNPFQAHGIRNARDLLRDLAADSSRTVVVIDPRRTETAAIAKHHLQLRPGTDAFLLAAMLSIIVREELQAKPFLDERTTGFEPVRQALLSLPVEDYAARAGIELDEVTRVARLIARAKSASVRVDLGLQQSLHSTLNSYLEKLLWLVTGHFGRVGCNTLHSVFLPLVGHSDAVGPGSMSWVTAATGVAEIGKLFPPNVLPEEIESAREDRIRALVVDSANPALSGADTQAFRRALPKLELLVTLDVALTETARLGHYVLPASSQFEKWETTFFQLEFPTQAVHLRKPLLPPKPGTLSEPEIYRRLLTAMGEVPESFPLLRAVASIDRSMPRLRLFPTALAAALKLQPRLQKYAAFVLRDTLGRALPEGAASVAPLWGAAMTYARKHPEAVRRAGLHGNGADLGEALFARMLEGRSGATISTHEPQDAFRFIRHQDRRIHLDIPELLGQLRALREERDGGDGYPLVLVAGERRAYNANLIFRDPDWRKSDRDGALHVHPEDAAASRLIDGGRAVCESARGKLEVTVAITDTVHPGMVTLPNGFGTDYPAGDGSRISTGPAVNVLTDARWRDSIAATPLHKHVRVRVHPLA